MKRRNLFVILGAILSLISASAQEKRTIGSKLNEATVYFSGAELTHTATATLVKGENEVVVEGISPSLDINSLKIKTTNNVVVSASEFSVDYLSSGKSVTPVIKKMEDSITIHRAVLDKVNIDLKINGTMLSHLQSGVEKNISGSEKGLGIEELMKTMDYYKSKSEEMEIAKAALLQKKQKLEETIARLSAQIDQESVKGNKTSGVLKLTMSSPSTVNSVITITYYTPLAGWIPYYDIHIASVDKPIVIGAKSKVRQTTGLDWEKVKLTLSTATPSNGKAAPLFSAWFLENIRYYKPAAPAMQNSYFYDSDSKELEEEVVADANLLQGKVSGIRIRGAGSMQASNEPLVVIDGVPSTQAELQAINPQLIKSMDVLKDAGATAIYGSRGANGVIMVTLKSGMDDFVTESENVMNVTYNIDLPYTIPGNGKVQNIDLLTKETSAEYKYYCAPKLDAETYLLAEISDWEKLGLLSGKANVTYDGTYVGETFIDASSTNKKLTLTLGTDKRIAVKREKMQDFSSKKLLGSEVFQILTYKLTVKNNQTKSVKMVLKDQYPISTQKNIEVILRKETTPWTANVEDLGVITWEEEFAPGESKTYQISYSVKFPKDLTLNL